MSARLAVCFAVLIGITGTFVTTLSAQRTEVSAYAGGFWPDRMPIGKLKSDGIWGIRAGTFLTERFEAEGGFGYINHFELSRTPGPSVRGMLWEATGVWNLMDRQIVRTPMTPYLTVGTGSLNAFIRGADEIPLSSTPRNIVMDDGDTFFMFSYGGGIKAMNMWGPLGLRADIRGRTIPNFYGHVTSWPEITGGLLFSWGER
jgi:hypothetical protein